MKVECTCCGSYAEEGYTPKEQRWEKCNDLWYCPDCYDMNEYGEVIFDGGKIRAADLNEVYNDLEVKRNEKGFIKSITGTLKTGLHISVNWVMINDCRISINHSVDRSVNGYMSLVRLVERYLSDSIYTNEMTDMVSGYDFIEARHSLLEPIWQTLKHIGGGRFADDNLFLNQTNRL